MLRSTTRLAATCALCASAMLESDAWCPGVQWDAVEPKLQDALIDVYFVQAPLFSNNPSIGDTLGQFNLFHTAVVFTQGASAWSLEYDLTAQNKAGSSPTAGFLPDINGDVLTWDSDARWCLTEGIHLGREHWTKKYDLMAQIQPSTFQSLISDFVPSLNGTNAQNASGVGFNYNLFQLKYAFGPVLLDDVSCGNGAIWVRDFLADSGVTVAKLDLSVTRIVLATVDGGDVDETNAEEWGRVVHYFSDLSEIITGSASVDEKIAMLNKTLPMRYWYNAHRGKYVRIAAMPVVDYSVPPLPWPKPSEHPVVPTPAPTPDLDCAFTQDLDWLGDDLSDYGSDSKEECCRTCASTAACVVSVWRKNAVPIPRQGHCWLKSGTSTPQVSSGRWGCVPGGMAGQLQLV